MERHDECHEEFNDLVGFHHGSSHLVGHFKGDLWVTAQALSAPSNERPVRIWQVNTSRKPKAGRALWH